MADADPTASMVTDQPHDTEARDGDAAELKRLRAIMNRFRQTLYCVNIIDKHARDAAIIADLSLSLRACAAKHGVGVSVVRTLRAKQEKDPWTTC